MKRELAYTAGGYRQNKLYPELLKSSNPLITVVPVLNLS